MSSQTIRELWRDALGDVVIRHHDPMACPIVRLEGDELHLSVANYLDTGQRTVARGTMLAVSSVKLSYFPGRELARIWLACAWAGYIQHEALELVTVGGDPKNRCLDPHRDMTHDRGLRAGLPTELTPLTLGQTLLTVMDREAAEELIRRYA